jgi:RNA polymerase subunit RPABC4/transcription elongation factor Spt4
MRKKKYCSNCHYVHPEGLPDNYCPQCGQANNEQIASTWTLLREIADNYISIDSKLLRSMASVLLLPGKLSKAFTNGQLVPYVSPIRLYFFCGFVYFTFFALYPMRIVDEQLEQQAQEYYNLPDSLLDIIDSKPQSIPNDTALSPNSKLSANAPNKADSTATPVIALPHEETDTVNDTSNLSLQEERDFRRLLHIIKNSSTHEIANDSLVLTKNYWYNHSDWGFFFKQTIKLYYAGLKGFMHYIVGILPLMVLLMIPLIAAIFKLLYVRSTYFYVQHLVFFLHYHSFLYLLLAISILGAYLNLPCVVITTILAAYIYLIAAIKSVYQQGWFKTWLKGNALIISYPFIITLYLLLTLFWSFLFF